MANKVLVKKMTRFIIQILFIGLTFGCMSSSNETAYCPQVGIVSDLDRLTEIDTRDLGSTTSILFSSRIQRLGVACKVSSDGVTVSTVMELFSKLSGYDTPADVHLSYLVATVDPNGRILAKEIYQTKIGFSDGMETVRKKEEVVVFIPSRVKSNLRGYKILIGFELTESQLQYNKGFR